MEDTKFPPFFKMTGTDKEEEFFFVVKELGKTKLMKAKKNGVEEALDEQVVGNLELPVYQKLLQTFYFMGEMAEMK